MGRRQKTRIDCSGTVSDCLLGTRLPQRQFRRTVLVNIKLLRNFLTEIVLYRTICLTGWMDPHINRRQVNRIYETISLSATLKNSNNIAQKTESNIRENIGFLLAKASQRWNVLLYEKFCEAQYHEVRPAYGSILVPLFEEDGLQIGELAKRARLSKQTMTTLLKLMEARGLVARQRDEQDARASRIYLTEYGRQFKSVSFRVLKEMDELVGKRLSKRDLLTLRRCLRELMNLGD
jgi:DNA-binding MarR family transcriptional regulator